jgi:hypothetical protein
VSVTDPGAPDQSAAYWTKLLSDPAFRAMPPEQRAEMLKRQVQEVRAQSQTGGDQQLGQTIGAVPKAKAQEPAQDGHPLDPAINDPNADHMGALERYVYGS